MELILLRHPRACGAGGRCYGRLDLAADAAALRHSIAHSAALRGLPVFSSPSRRCRALARALHPAPVILPGLAELDFGRWEGCLWDDIPRVEIDAWAADPWNYRPGGGESALAMTERWRATARQLYATGLPKAVLVTHAGLIRLALGDAGLLPPEHRLDSPIAHDTPYRLELSCPP